MSERLQNVLRILEGGASERRRTQLGLGPGARSAASGVPIAAHRIVGVGEPTRIEIPPEPAEHSANPDDEPLSELPELSELDIEEAPAEERGSALAVYERQGADVAIVTARVVDTRAIGLPSVLDPRLVLLREPQSAQAKSFRLLAHRVRHAGDPRVILVTSPRQSEGKTTCAANLALALAEDGSQRVLLLEANARTPSHAAMFGLGPVVGLPRQLVRLETAQIPWSAYEIAGTGLSILPAEPRDAVIGRGLFGAAIADMRSAFDYVIVDAPSVLDSADVTALCDAVDGAVLCVRSKKSRVRELERATQQLAPARVLGVALLDVKEARGS